ncbi:hypothetical protein [Maribellus mangrovi]|uniref:hypothetical protein n=1 Tax=Maribellus mangrovi TaxID=3133146 RepID=UPI0030EF0A6E
MALGKAIKFIKKVGFDNDLRSSCYRSNSKAELLEQLGFDEVEFDDAINMQLVKCQSYEQAEHFQQLRMWFSML